MKVSRTKSESSPSAAPFELPIDDDALVDESFLAALLDLKPRTMRLKRYEGTGPKYVRISKNIIKYRAGAIREFIRSREFGSTSEESAGGDV